MICCQEQKDTHTIIRKVEVTVDTLSLSIYNRPCKSRAYSKIFGTTLVPRTLLKRMKETNSRTLTGPNVRMRARLAQSITNRMPSRWFFPLDFLVYMYMLPWPRLFTKCWGPKRCEIRKAGWLHVATSGSLQYSGRLGKC